MAENELHVEPVNKSKPRSASAKALRHAAHNYLQRYPSSKANLRRVLRQRLDRAVHAYGPAQNGTREDIETILNECEAAGLIDDTRYANRMAEVWLARGESLRAIQARLSRKGVGGSIIDKTLSALKENNQNADLQAVVSLVRRRRLGPLRHPDKRADALEKDLGVLARAGFPYHLARRVLDAEDDAGLEDLLEETKNP